MTVFSIQEVDTLKSAAAPYSCWECPWVFGVQWPWECPPDASI